MSTDYIVFDRALAERFARLIAGRGIAARVRPDAMEGFVVEIPGELDEDAEAAIEADYEAIMAEQRDAVESAQGDEARTLMAVTVTLPGGETCVVPLRAELARRLYELLTLEEVQELVSEIAAAARNPLPGSLCARVAK